MAGLQGDALAAGDGGPATAAIARSESTAELLCAELCADGLPMDRDNAEKVLAGIIGPRPRGEAEAAAMRAARDAAVLRHAPAGVTADLRSPAQVRSLLAAAGVEVPDTRAWRLEEFKDSHPLVAGLLEWRKAERIATTYGYAWLDEHLGPDGRLRGAWTGSDGAAGRMTATGGLHNMPAAMRRAVIAAPGHRARGRPARPPADRAARAGRGGRRRRARRGYAGRRHVPAGRGGPRRGPPGRQGRDDRGDVRPDHRARRPGRPPDARCLPGCDGLP